MRYNSLLTFATILACSSPSTAYGEQSAPVGEQGCKVNSEQDKARLLNTRLTEAMVNKVRAIATLREEAGLAALPGFPLCWNMRAAASSVAEHEPSVAAIKRLGLTPMDYVSVLINIQAYRNPDQLGWLERERWSQLMMENSKIVGKLDF